MVHLGDEIARPRNRQKFFFAKAGAPHCRQQEEVKRAFDPWRKAIQRVCRKCPLRIHFPVTPRVLSISLRQII